MVILSIIFILVGLGLLFTTKMYDQDKYPNGSKIQTISGWVVIVFAVLFFVLSTFYVVQPGEVGIEILFGKVVQYAPSGINGKNPFALVVKMDLKTQKYELKLEGASKDLQEITADVAINYRLNYEKIAELYNKIGVDYVSKVIDPAVLNLSKAAISQFAITDVVVERNKLAKTIFDSLNERLNSYFIILETVNLNNIAFSKAFTVAVTEKQVQEQKVQTAEYRRQQAEKDKESTILDAQAEAEKQRLLRQTTSKEVIELKWIEKWNGQLPTYMLGDDSVPMVNLNK
jgi:prohibitin 1